MPRRPEAPLAGGAALTLALLLLLPGGCFLGFGIHFATDNTLDAEVARLEAGIASWLLPIAAVILAPAGLLFWIGARHRPAPALVWAIALLAPGASFLIVGIGGVTGALDPIPLLVLSTGVAILALAGLLFWLAFRRRTGPDAPPDR